MIIFILFVAGRAVPFYVQADGLQSAVGHVERKRLSVVDWAYCTNLAVGTTVELAAR